MKSISILIATAFSGVLLASDHPADEAREALQKAITETAKAEKEFIESLQLVRDDAKRGEILNFFQKRNQAWAAYMEADASLKAAASPAPSTSTSVGLIPLWSDARHLRTQTKELREQTKWIRENWSVEAASPLPNGRTDSPPE